jgi:hypothetical protein
VVEALAANRADDAFHVGALPRGFRLRRRLLIANPRTDQPYANVNEQIGEPKKNRLPQAR